MAKKLVNANLIVILLVVSGFAAYNIPANAGSLEPTAAPGPTMKTLDEVEPRIPISQADFPKTISSSGSYYFTEDVSTSGVAITVNANDVTIDLAGFVLSGPGGAVNSYGIYINGRSNVEIRNGTVRDFRYGTIEVSASGREHRVIDVRALSNGRYGIYLTGSDNLVKNCTASNNGNSATVDVYGIYAGSGSTVTGNTVRNNGISATGTVVYGIYAGDGSMVSGNTANDNGNLATGTVYGIYADNSCVVTGNIAYNNKGRGIRTSAGSTITGNTAYNNQGDGIRASDGSTITGNTTAYNSGNGIQADSGSTVTGNTVFGNQGNGIYAGGIGDDGCTITGNTAYNNQNNGIDADNGSTITGNTVRNNNQVNASLYAGIRVGSGCLVKGNTLSYNKQNNIYVSGGGNAIEENLLTNSLYTGIYFNFFGNFYANNRAWGHTTDYGGILPSGGGDGGGNASF